MKDRRQNLWYISIDKKEVKNELNKTNIKLNGK